MSTAYVENVSFLSCDRTTPIHGVIWWPEDTPCAIVQLVHGMAEHIMRYDAFARFLNDEGFLVFGHDQLGHGDSVLSPDLLGHIPIKGGFDILVGDVARGRALIRDRAQMDLPHFIFGHSMGSFVTRAYIAKAGKGLAGAILCGTGHITPALSTTGNALAHLIARTRGARHVSKLLNNLSVGSYAKAIPNARTPLDWLSYNVANVDAYIADERAGFPFTAGGNAALTALTGKVCTLACCRRVPHDLPLLYIAGDADPVGDYGKGVQTAANMARGAGSVDVTCTIYPHMRHEILNETDGIRDMTDVSAWMKERL